MSVGFKQSFAGDCTFFRGMTNFMLYVDDGIFMGSSKSDIETCINDMKTILNLTDKGGISDYYSIKVTKLPDGLISLMHPYLIDIIIKDPNFAVKTKPKGIPGKSSTTLKTLRRRCV